MGMDIYGSKPSGQRGKYFPTTRYWWGPLADYCITVSPDICAPCKYWYGNDGDGLDAAGSVALADALQKEVDSGRVETYVQQYAAEQELLPDESCSSCFGGMVQSVLLAGGGELKDFRIECARCRGTGYCHPVPPFSIENVGAFIAFLRESGGFEIS
jgi:hypothetical protein